MPRNTFNQRDKDNMKRILFVLLALALFSQLTVADEIWTEKAQNPSWWPYRHYDPKRSSVREDMVEWYADMEPPCPTNRTVTAFYGNVWRKAVLVSTNIQIVATDEEAVRKYQETPESERNPTDMRMHMLTRVYLKSSYKRSAAMAGLQHLSVNIGMTVKGLEYQ